MNKRMIIVHVILGFVLLSVISCAPATVIKSEGHERGAKIRNSAEGGVFETSGDIIIYTPGKKILTYKLTASSGYELSDNGVQPLLSPIFDLIYLRVDRVKGIPQGTELEELMRKYLTAHGYTLIEFVIVEIPQ